MSSLDLAQYACDECRRRKLRCTREKPACEQCISGKRSCEYSRHGIIHRKVRKRLSSEEADGAPSSLEDRLSNIEDSISHLTSLVESLARSMGQEVSKEEDFASAHSLHTAAAPKNSIKPVDFPSLGLRLESGPGVDPHSHDGSQHSDDDVDSRVTSRGVTELSEAFGAMVFDDDIRARVRQFRRAGEQFYIPTPEDGARILDVFTWAWDLTKGFFQSPPNEEVWHQVLYAPSTVQERGWVIVFNCIMSTHYTLKDYLDIPRSNQFRWNTWLALDESSALFEPSIPKLQAFLLLATHCQEYATPNLSWTFLSHACRIFQSIGLPKPSAVNDKPYGEESQRLLLFWSVYIVDRSLALALGRPTFLDEAICEKVPLPSLAQMAVFEPHKERFSTPDFQNLSTDTLGYGALYLGQSLKFSKLCGRLLSNSTIASFRNHTDSSKFRRDLSAWFKETVKVLSSRIELAKERLGPREVAEQETGLSYMSFQYHHITVICTRDNKATRGICIEAARGALSHLKGLVSSSAQLYNGITWQLLYFPFTHFFIIFGEIISDPKKATCPGDLRLLQDTVLFFEGMRENHQSAMKLGNVARTFVRLAKAYVQRSKGVLPSGGTAKSGFQIQGNEAPSTETNGLLQPTSTYFGSEVTNSVFLPISAEDDGHSYSSLTLTPELDGGVDPMLMDFYSSVVGPWDPTSADAGAKDFPSLGDPLMENTEFDMMMYNLAQEAVDNTLPFNLDWLSWDI